MSCSEKDCKQEEAPFPVVVHVSRSVVEEIKSLTGHHYFEDRRTDMVHCVLNPKSGACQYNNRRQMIA